MAKLPLFFGNYKKFPKYFVRKLGVLLLFAVFTTLSAFSQQIAIKGKVFEENSKATIIGAAVKIKGQKVGTVSDVNGNFSLNVKSLPVTLVVSNTGYKNQEIDVYEAEPTAIYLAEDQNRLSTVVVVGYGTQKRSEVTGSIASVSTGSLKQTPVSSFENALGGKAAGVNVIQTSGQPGAAVSIRIRGGNSINGNNEPLYVIDGFPVYNENANADAGSVSGASINALASLNPSDIESIDVLKDASATAIYGARGSNGVVQITTKKGKAGKTQISYETYFGVQQLGRKIPLLNAQQFGQLRNDAIQTSNDVVTKTGSGVIKPLYYSAAQLDSLGSVTTDWQSAAFRDAPVQNHQISITGGDDKTHFAITGNYFKQDGILLNSDFERYSSRLNLDRKISDKFKVGENITLSQTSANEAPTGIVNTILAVRPDFPIYNADGSFTYKQPGEAALGNPIATLVNQTNLSKTFRLIGNLYGEYIVFPGLTAKVTFGLDKINNNQSRYVPSTLSEGNGIGYAYRGTKSTTTWSNENTLNYVKQIKENSFNLLAGFSQEKTQIWGFNAANSGFSNDILLDNSLGAGTTVLTPSSRNTLSTLESFFGRFRYSLKEKYTFEATARADGSSRFGKNNKWGYFPSAAVSWDLAKENFLKNSKLVSNAKVRLSVGQTGNQEIGLYNSQALLGYYSYIVGDKLVAGYAPTGIANPDLTWETTTQYDAGFDFGFFNNRISLVIDAYYKKTSNLLLNVTLPATSGQLTGLENDGTVENKGLEITLNTENVSTKSFTWNTNLNFSLNRNKILSLGDGVDYINNYNTDGTFISKVGQPVGSFYVLLADGVAQATDDLNNNPTNKTPTIPGYQKYKDINHDGKISIANDRVIVGSAQPKFSFGITNTLS